MYTVRDYQYIFFRVHECRILEFFPNLCNMFTFDALVNYLLSLNTAT
jgi:hypothetical protein